MKSLKEYSLPLSEQEYHDLPLWSYSLIARYAREGFSAMATIHDKVKPTPAMEFGSLFDSILTRGKETMNEYIVSDTCPTEGIKNVLDTLLLMTDVPFYDIPSFTMESAFSACNYYSNRSYDSKYKQIEPFRDYYESRREKKKVVSKFDWDDAVEMARIFRQDSYLSNLFGTKNTKDVEYIYQAKFKTKVTLDNGKTVEVKIMPDLLVVNHKDKTIQPVDLKTSSEPAFSFEESFVRQRYDLQAQCYSDVLSLIILGDKEYNSYTILDYLFTDVSRSDKIPVTWKYPQNDVSQADGFSFGNYKYKNWKTLLQEMVDYEDAQAKVPSYITTEGPNDLLAVLNRKSTKDNL